MDKKYFKILAIVVVTLAAVVALISVQKNQKNPGQVTVNNGAADTAKKFEAVQGEPDYVWFPVTELGIEIKVRKDIASEIVYLVKKSATEPDIASVGFTTKRLLDIGEKLGYGKTTENGGFVCSIGGFTRYNMSEKEYTSIQEERYGERATVRPINFDGYFVEYASPQSGCIDENSPDAEYEQRVITSWWGRPTSEYTEQKGITWNLQNSVRRIQ